MRYAMLLSLFICSLLTGCSGRQKALVGTWRDDNARTTVQFFADGKATLEQFGVANPSWYKVRGNQLTIGAVPGQLQDNVVTFKVSGDTLTMSREAAFGGTGASVWTQTFKRLKEQ